jgi:hypothetical protein
MCRFNAIEVHKDNQDGEVYIRRTSIDMLQDEKFQMLKGTGAG